MTYHLLVHPRPGTRAPVIGDLLMNMGEDDMVRLAMLDLVHRLACEAADLHAMGHPKSQEFMERETGRTGWRAYLSQETAHLVHVLEKTGIATFELEGDA